MHNNFNIYTGNLKEWITSILRTQTNLDTKTELTKNNLLSLFNIKTQNLLWKSNGLTD